MPLKFEKTIDGIFSLSIDENNKATISMDEIGPVIVQLENEEEVQKMIAEFEDPEGELMYAEDSVFGKYPELHQFRS